VINILLLGSGGRENALAWKMAQSPLCGNLFIAPGNPGTELYGANIPLSVNDFSAIGEFCLEENIEMLVVGPEDPLVNGITDYFLADDSLRKIPVIGPDKKPEMLNYRVKDDMYIVDRLFDRAELVLGAGKKARKVEIIRETRRTS